MIPRWNFLEVFSMTALTFLIGLGIGSYLEHQIGDSFEITQTVSELVSFDLKTMCKVKPMYLETTKYFCVMNMEKT